MMSPWHLAGPVTVRESEGLTTEGSKSGHAWHSCPALMPQLLLPVSTVSHYLLEAGRGFTIFLCSGELSAF